MRLPTFTLIPLMLATTLGSLTPRPAAAAWATASPLVTPPATTSLVLKAPSRLSSSWRRIARIPYGIAAARLGTSPGGDDGSINWGPSYGTQLPDKTWWYADAAKMRLAHYSDAGGYLGQVKLPTKFLASGQYFQWQNPQALADGTVVLTSTSGDSPGLLLLSPSHTLKRVALARFVNAVITDGHRLYGFDINGNRVRIAPKTGAITAVSKLSGQGGYAFNITLGAGFLRVIRPGVDTRINLTSAAHPAISVHPSIEVAMGATGKLWILVTGIVEVTPQTAETVIGLFNVSSTGTVSAVSRVRNPTSDSDPGDGHHLGIRHGGTRPWLMFVDEDALRVYRRN